MWSVQKEMRRERSLLTGPQSLHCRIAGGIWIEPEACSQPSSIIWVTRSAWGFQTHLPQTSSTS